MKLQRRGVMFVLSSPSGAGKSSLARLLLQEENNVELSVSVTTRKRRMSEIEGQHYFFVDEADFHKLAKQGDLLEWAEVHGNFYGTPRQPVEKALSAGRDILFDIDYQGTEQLYEKLPQDLVRVFILPPSMRELKNRLVRRAEDSSDVIAQRLAKGRNEIEQWRNYDYVIVNEDLDQSFHAVRSILGAERRRRQRLTGMEKFVSELLSEGLDNS